MLILTKSVFAASLPGSNVWCGYGDTCNGANNWFYPFYTFNYAVDIPSDSPVKGYLAQPRVCVRGGQYYGPTVYIGVDGEVISTDGRCPVGTVAFPNVTLKNINGESLSFWKEEYHWAWEYCGYGMNHTICVDASGALGNAQQ